MARRARRPLPTPRLRAAVRAPVAGRGLGVLLVAFGLLFLQGPRLLHMLLISHTTCEHGELVEVAPEPKYRAIEASDSDPKQDRAAPGHGEGAGHDHCDALALRHLPSGVGPALCSPSLLIIEPLASLAERDEQRPLPLLSLAPKSSPPGA